MGRTVGPAGPINEKTYAAQSAITRGYFVARGTADGTCTAVTAAGQQVIGLATQEGSIDLTGYAIPVTRLGDGVAIAGAPIPYGSYVKVDALGRPVPVVGTAGDGEQIVGRAESTATALGEEVVIFVNPSVL